MIISVKFLILEEPLAHWTVVWIALSGHLLLPWQSACTRPLGDQKAVLVAFLGRVASEGFAAAQPQAFGMLLADVKFFSFPKENERTIIFVF